MCTRDVSEITRVVCVGACVESAALTSGGRDGLGQGECGVEVDAKNGAVRESVGVRGVSAWMGVGMSMSVGSGSEVGRFKSWLALLWA